MKDFWVRSLMKVQLNFMNMSGNRGTTGKEVFKRFYFDNAYKTVSCKRMTAQWDYDNETRECLNLQKNNKNKKDDNTDYKSRYKKL